MLSISVATDLGVSHPLDAFAVGLDEYVLIGRHEVPHTLVHAQFGVL